MGRRANKKSKKVKLTDKHKPKSMRKLCGRNMLKSGTYKSTDRFMEKARANAQFGEMFMPDVIGYGAEMEQAIVVNDGREIEQEFISNISDWHIGSSINESIEDIRRAMSDIINDSLRFPDIVMFSAKRTENADFCAVCNMMLNYNYPEDYPDEWKFCCYCQPRAIKLIDGRLKPTTNYLKKIYDKITLVKGNDN